LLRKETKDHAVEAWLFIEKKTNGGKGTHDIFEMKSITGPGIRSLAEDLWFRE